MHSHFDITQRVLVVEDVDEIEAQTVVLGESGLRGLDAQN